MHLEDWRKNGWLIEHRTSRREIQDLLTVADRDLADSHVKGLSADLRLNIAYNAALQLATAALAAEGYRAARESHHYRIIQSLAKTVALDGPAVAVLDAFRKKRNLSGYERAGLISDIEAEEMAQLAEQLREMIVHWMKEKHPNLV